LVIFGPTKACGSKSVFFFPFFGCIAKSYLLTIQTQVAQAQSASYEEILQTGFGLADSNVNKTGHLSGKSAQMLSISVLLTRTMYSL